MDERQWLTSDDPAAMMEYLSYGGGDPFASFEGPSVEIATNRKLMLFATACAVQCYGEAHALNRHLGGYDEWYEGKAESKERANLPWRVARSWCAGSDQGIVAVEKAELLRHILGNPFRSVWRARCDNDCMVPKPHKDGVFRVFESCGPDSKWITCPSCSGLGYVPGQRPHIIADVRQLAQALYDGDQTAVVPLHDALIDASLEELVDHFAAEHIWEVKNKLAKDMGYHYENHPRGCWALDAILNLE